MRALKIATRAMNYIKEGVVNFICEVKSVSKQDVLIVVTCSGRVVQ